MKRLNLWKWVMVFVIIALTTPAQAQGWKDLLGNLKDGVDKVVNKVTVNDSTIIGKWNYSQPVCKFKSENLLAQAGGVAVSNKVEEQLEKGCQKLTVSPENTSFEFKNDGTYVQTIAGKKSEGTYSFDRENMKVVMTGKLGFSQTAHVKFSKNSMTMVYDADRILSIAKGVANVAAKFMDGNMITLFNSISENYEGMQLGFELEK